jgi:hypothetical protein
MGHKLKSLFFSSSKRDILLFFKIREINWNVRRYAKRRAPAVHPGWGPGVGSWKGEGLESRDPK